MCSSDLSVLGRRACVSAHCCAPICPAFGYISLRPGRGKVLTQSSPKPMCIELVMPSSHLILCHALLLLPPIPPSIRVFSNESTLRRRWPKYWSFSFSISPSNEHTGLIFFRMDWLDLLAVQGTLKSLSNNTVQKHQVFSAQLSL